jgi:hypothetical protein
MAYFTRDMRHASANKALKRAVIARSVPAINRSVSARPAAVSLRSVLAADRSYPGNVIRNARARHTATFVSDAAEAKWAHGVLAKEWAYVQQCVNGGWWEDDPTIPTLMKIELQSRMRGLERRYGHAW